MQIDWFLVVGFTVTFVLAGYALWLNGKGKADKSDRNEAEKPTSH